MTERARKWWAYRHINGGIHLKRFFDQATIEDAYESDFVEDVLDPFPANTRAEAAARVCAHFKTEVEL